MEKDINEIKKEYEKLEGWGLLSTIDLHSCNPDFMRDKEKIKAFVIELCNRIDMKRFSETQIFRFGEGNLQGYSVVQLIKTSLISLHCAEQTNRVFLDIFSCKFYNPYDVAEFTKEFFQAKDYKLNYLIRK